MIDWFLPILLFRISLLNSQHIYVRKSDIAEEIPLLCQISLKLLEKICVEISTINTVQSYGLPIQIATVAQVNQLALQFAWK